MSKFPKPTFINCDVFSGGIVVEYHEARPATALGEVTPCVVITMDEYVHLKKNRSAVKIGKLGGSKGGQARARNLSPEARAEIARKAAQARWKKKD